MTEPDLNERTATTRNDLVQLSSRTDPQAQRSASAPSGEEEGSQPRPSFYDHIGGAATVREAVDRLYQLILTDPELVPYFEGKDLPQLKSHMAALLTKVLGGPDGYAGRDLAQAHQGLGITEEHFYRVADFLINVLLNMGVDNNVVAAVSLTMAAVKDQIVGRNGQDGVAALGEVATPIAEPNACVLPTADGDGNG